MGARYSERVNLALIKRQKILRHIDIKSGLETKIKVTFFYFNRLIISCIYPQSTFLSIGKSKGVV